MLDFVSYYMLVGIALFGIVLATNFPLVAKMYKEDGLNVTFSTIIVLITMYPYLIYRIMKKDY